MMRYGVRQICMLLACEILDGGKVSVLAEGDFGQIRACAEYFSVPLDLLKAKTRKKEVVTARQVAMYFAKEHTSHSLKSIGHHFGGRDHSTVIHSVQTVSDLIDSDKSFRSTIVELRKKFAGR